MTEVQPDDQGAGTSGCATRLIEGGEGDAWDGRLTECCDEDARQAFPIYWHFCLAFLCPVLWVAYPMCWPGYLWSVVPCGYLSLGLGSFGLPLSVGREVG